MFQEDDGIFGIQTCGRCSWSGSININTEELEGITIVFDIIKHDLSAVYEHPNAKLNLEMAFGFLICSLKWSSAPIFPLKKGQEDRKTCVWLSSLSPVPPTSGDRCCVTILKHSNAFTNKERERESRNQPKIPSFCISCLFLLGALKLRNNTNKEDPKMGLPTTSKIVEKLNLAPNPEGGLYSETFRDSSVILSTSQLPPECKFIFLSISTLFVWFSCFSLL